MKQRGFTIIELLIVISIIVILTGIVLVSYRTGEQRFALQRSANKLAQDIRRVQEMAMSAQEFQGSVSDGYGIHLKTSWEDYYILYSDDGNNSYMSGSGDNIIETIYLEEGVDIRDLLPSSSISINFAPPDPTTEISGNGTAEIFLCLKNDPDCLTNNTYKKVIVNEAGRIDID